MIKISDVVFEIIQSDEVALEAIRMGLLNLSAYARQILPLVAERTHKPVSRGAIVTALSRMKDRLNNIPPLQPLVKIEDMSIKSPLVEISYEKTAKTVELASKLNSKSLLGGNFFTVTYGVGEISFIVSEKLKGFILKNFNIAPKAIYDELVAVTVRFNKEDYVEVPNVIYTLVSTLARRRINIIEIISTFTEISFIVRKKEMIQTTDALKFFFTSKKTAKDV